MKKVRSVLLAGALLAALAAPACAAGDVVWTQNTRLQMMRNEYDSATVAAGVTVELQNWRPDPMGLEIHKSLTVEPGGTVTGGCLIFYRGATCTGLDLYYAVAGEEKRLTLTLDEVLAAFPQDDYYPTFLFDPYTGHYVLVADFGNDPFEKPEPATPGVDGDHTVRAAEALKELGLFQGSDKGFELDRAPSRMEEVILLIRLLGKEEAALSGDGTHPFEDVTNWGDDTRPQRYVGFAYANKLTNGVGDTDGNGVPEFGMQQTATAQMFVTFVLRAMGYKDPGFGGTDFTYDGAVAFAMEKGLIAGSADVESFDRGACVRIMEAALRQNTNGGDLLWKTLAAEGVFTEEAYKAAFGV